MPLKQDFYDGGILLQNRVKGVRNPLGIALFRRKGAKKLMPGEVLATVYTQ
jgi:hypothetical protein